MAKMALRTPDDLKRLFSALGDDLTHEEMGLSNIQAIDLAALEAHEGLDGVDSNNLLILGAVAMATAWAAIRGYERNHGSMGHGLAWGTAGFLFPLPVVAYTAFADRRAT